MVSPEDIEAIDILITQRRNEEASLDKEIKEEPVLKDGKQTDGSCDRTTGSGTDATDATDTQKGKQHKKRICRKLNKEFIVYVGEERTKMCLVECSDSNSLPETSESDFQILGTASNSNSEESASSSNSEDSDKSGSNSDRSDKSDKNSNSEETSKESEVSVEEIEVPRKSFPIYDVDSNSNSDKTEDIYKAHMDGSKISLATVSTISTEPCTPKTMVTEQSTTFPYSQSDESIQFLSEEERLDKKESEENNVTGATDEKEDIEDGQQNNGEQVKYSVDTEPVSPVETTRAPSPVPVSPVKNNGEQDSVDKRAPSPVPVSPEEKPEKK